MQPTQARLAFFTYMALGILVALILKYSGLVSNTYALATVILISTILAGIILLKNAH